MKGLLNTKKGWFWLTYVAGMVSFVLYLLFTPKSVAASYANTDLMVFAHMFTLGACSICERWKVRRKILRRSFATFVMIFSTVVLLAPQTMGLVAAYALFCGIGYYHIRILKEEDLFGHIKMAERPEDMSELSDRQFKYVFWAVMSSLPLLFLYWGV